MSQSYESAPEAPPGPPPGGPSGPRSNFGQRLGAYLIDAILITVVVVALYYISTILYLIGLLGWIAYWVVLVGNATRADRRHDGAQHPRRGHRHGRPDRLRSRVHPWR